MKKYILHVLIILVFLTAIYNSKRDYYNKKKSFYNKDFDGWVLKKVESEYTIIFYNEKDFFYSEFVEDVYFSKGDHLIKKDSILLVNDKQYVIEKLPENYFYFFFKN